MQYIPVETQKMLDQRYKVAAIIVVAFLFSVIAVMFVARLISPSTPVPGSEKWMQPIYTLVIVLGISTVILRRFLFSRMAMNRAAARGPAAVLKNLSTVSILCAAIAETVAIIGLVGYILTVDYQYSWRLGVVGILLLLYSFPRRGEWTRAVAASVSQ